MAKAQRLEAWFTALTDSELSKVAERLLAHCSPAPDIRNSIENILWSNQYVDTPRRVRRELARGLSITDLYRDARHFEALLDRFWVLDDDPMGAFLLETRNVHSLRKRIERHVFRNPEDWSVEELFDHLGALAAPSPRFIRFTEALTSADVHKDDSAQRNLVASANPHLRPCNIELRETGTEEGYLVFTAAVLTDKPFAAPKQLIFASPVKPDIRFRSAVDNDIEIVSNADRVFVYDLPIGADGLTWSALQSW